MQYWSQRKFECKNPLLKKNEQYLIKKVLISSNNGHHTVYKNEWNVAILRQKTWTFFAKIYIYVISIMWGFR